MNIWFISDTHNRHAELKVPKDVELVIHCGDESESGNAWMNEPEARNFFDWYSGLEIPTKIFVPGNHSTAIEQGLIRAEEYPEVKFLIHQQTQWQEFKIFGSPYTPRFFDWAYMRERSDLDIMWESIPDDIDILIVFNPLEVNALPVDKHPIINELFNRDLSKIRYNLDVLLLPSDDINKRSYWRGWFGYSRTEIPKGIPRIFYGVN